MNHLHVFTTSTGKYNDYIPTQICTLDNLFPGIKKTYNHISDKRLDIYYASKSKDIDKYVYYHTANLPRELFVLCKFNYVVDMCLEHNYKDDEIILFVDADSIFLDKTYSVKRNQWDDLIEQAEANNAILSISPWWDKGYGQVYRENFGNTYSASFIPEPYFDNTIYVQSSFLMCKVRVLKDLVYDMCNIAQKDYSSKHPSIPLFHDQSLLNFIVHTKIKQIPQFLNLVHDTYNIKLGHYVYNSYLNEEVKSAFQNSLENKESHRKRFENIESIPVCATYFENTVYSNEVFIIQKYNTGVKSEKRDNKKFDYNL